MLDTVKYDNHYSGFLNEISENKFGERKLVDVIKENDSIVNELLLLGLIPSKSKVSSNSLDNYYAYSISFRNFINDNADMIVRTHDSIEIEEDFVQSMEENVVYKYSVINRDYYVCKNNRGEISQRIKLSEKIKNADDFHRTLGPTTIRGDWWAGFYLDMGNVSREGDVSYDNGKKPVRLISQLIDFATSENDIIMDFFSGSATTAHAAIELSAKSDTKRRFILVQYPENLDDSYNKADANIKKGIKNSITFLDGISKPHFITEIGKERIRRASKKIAEENPDAKFDGGFKVFEVADTNIRWNTTDDNKMKSLIDEDFVANQEDIDFVNGYNDIDVVYEIMLRQFDIPLSTPIEKLPEVSDRTYIFADAVVVCLDAKIDDALIEKLSSIEPTPAKFVLRDSAFGDDIELKDVSFRRLSALISNHQTEEERKSKYNNYTVEFI